MITITKDLAKETFNAVIDGETVAFKIVPQMSSSLRRNLVFWQMEKPDGEDSWRKPSETIDGDVSWRRPSDKIDGEKSWRRPSEIILTDEEDDKGSKRYFDLIKLFWSSES